MYAKYKDIVSYIAELTAQRDHARHWATYLAFTGDERVRSAVRQDWFSVETGPSAYYCTDQDGELRNIAASDGWQVGAELK